MSKKQDEVSVVAKLSRLSHQMVCLRNVSRLLSEADTGSINTYDTLVHLLPEGLQHSTLASVRIRIGDQEVVSTNFVETQWGLSTDILSGERPIGYLQVYYKEAVPEADEGPFLTEERQLLETVASEIGMFEERRRMHKARDRHLRELDLYSSLLRHDIRNDLGIIMGNMDLLRMLIADHSEELDDVLTSTEAVCDRMLQLVSTFGKQAAAAETNIGRLITEVVRLGRESSPHLEVELSFSGNSEETRIPESRLLPLVFDNLLRNAAVHAGDSPTVVIKVSRTGGSLEILVCDDGPGIDESIRARLFQKGASTRGGGLGLYLSREVLETIGGSIELADSDSGVGACFLVTLPST